MRVTWTRMPFHFTTTADYEAKLSAYISQVFYDILPAAGFEVREEQIYTSFRIARALAKGQHLLAEAGLGTGKTFAYLVPAICHARLKGSPVVLSSASGILQEQLASPDGDAAALSRLLDLTVDVRTARHPALHLCELKVEALRASEPREPGVARLLQWAEASEFGMRTEIPEAADETWELVAWDAGMACDACARRGHCRLTRAREQYRQAADLLVCDHHLFFKDLWSRRERREAGLQPMLPPYSGVVFDEGHDMPDAARRAAGYRIDPQALLRNIRLVSPENGRANLLRAAAHASRSAREFWAALQAAVIPAEADKLHLNRADEALTGAAHDLTRTLGLLEDELAIEEAMNEETPYGTQIQTLQARFDNTIAALAQLSRPSDEVIAWYARGQSEELWVVPRHTDALLQRELYSQEIPVIWSSATLETGDSFAYMKRAVGAPDALHTQVGAPFDLSTQMLVYIPEGTFDPMDRLREVLDLTRGRALVLVSSAAEQEQVRSALQERPLPWPVLWEGEAERAELLKRFKADIPSVLVGKSFWEGVDVPGEALSCLVVLRLPFPPHDPVVTAARTDAVAGGLDPFLAVDVPAMAMKLKQGRGRLIRSQTDIGVFALLENTFAGTAHEAAVRGALPEEAGVTSDLSVVRGFLTRPAQGV